MVGIELDKGRRKKCFCTRSIAYIKSQYYVIPGEETRAARKFKKNGGAKLVTVVGIICPLLPNWNMAN